MGADADPISGRQRLESWKEIASYLNRHVTTVRRWERHEGLPVHRHRHNKLGSVYAFRDEIDAWWNSRRVQLEQQPEHESRLARTEPSPDGRTRGRGRALLALAAAVALVVGAVAGLGMLARPPRTEAPRIASLAVLPLDNLSGDPSQDYVADGLTDALIGRLARIRALRVVSPTSSMAFRGSREPLPVITKALGVDAVVQGSVQRSGDRLRVAVRLIDARTDTHLWARAYERQVTDILGLQAELAEDIVGRIHVQMTPLERAGLGLVAAVDPAAYQEYVVGRYHLWRDSDEHLKRAIEHFERATTTDPQFAAAFASLGHAWWKRGLWSRNLASTERPARLAVDRALALDGDQPEALVVQADIARLYDHDLLRAEALVTRALTLAPGSVEAHYAYGLLLMTLGRFAEAIQHMERAERLDPLAPAIQSDYGRVLYRARRYDEALTRLNRALELEPSMDWLVYSRLSQAYERMDLLDQALWAIDRAEASASANPTERPSLLAQRAVVLARMGRRDEARTLLDSLEQVPGAGALARAAAYAALGDRDRAFALLFAAIAQGPGPRFAAVEPALDGLHSDPRWPELLRQSSTPLRRATASP